MQDLHTTLQTRSSSLQLHTRHCPDPTVTPRVGAVLLHPWARLGGCYDDPTVLYIFAAISAASGMLSTVCRYNMRGAHSSSGGSSSKLTWQAQPDVADLTEVCAFLLETLNNPPEHLYFIGYSYGSCVGALTLQRQLPQVVGFVSIAHPLAWSASLLLGSRKAWAAMVEAVAVRRLLVLGTHDSFTPLQLFDEYVAAAKAAAPGAQLQVAHVQEADHFFVGRWDEVAALVLSWLRRAEAARLAAAQPHDQCADGT